MFSLLASRDSALEARTDRILEPIFVRGVRLTRVRERRAAGSLKSPADFQQASTPGAAPASRPHLQDRPG